MSDDPTLPLLHDAWTTLVELATSIPADGWDRPTDCPGWTVKDQFAHITGSERTLDGEPVPGPLLRPPHVRNDLGAFNEAWVEHYRPQSPETLVADLRRVTAHRWEVVEALTPEQLQEDFLSPVGVIPLLQFFGVRVLDITAHDHDVRRALGMPIDASRPEVDFCVVQMLRQLPRVVGKQAALPDGTLLELVVEGSPTRSTLVHVDGGRGRVLEVAPSAATVVVDVDALTYLQLSWGRLTGAAALERALVGIDGAREFGRRLVENMNVML